MGVLIEWFSAPGGKDVRGPPRQFAGQTLHLLYVALGEAILGGKTAAFVPGTFATLDSVTSAIVS